MIVRRYILVAISIAAFWAPLSRAATKEQLDAQVRDALTRMETAIPAGREFAQRAAGMLVFPRVMKAGFVVGAEVGEGALLVNGETVQYYRTTALSAGLQLGVSGTTEVILFMTPFALASFRASNGWKAGVDGGIAVLVWGAEKGFDTYNVRDNIVAFVFDHKGLMYDLSLDGSRYWKIDK